MSIVGKPSFPTGCDVVADWWALLASGGDVVIVVSARIEQEGDLLEISHLPPDRSPEQVEEHIHRLVHNWRWRDPQSGTAEDRSRRGNVRNETTSRAGTASSSSSRRWRTCEV